MGEEMAGQALPVIVGFGGVNAAGRSSGHHSYARTVHSALSGDEQRRTMASLAALMGIDDPSSAERFILDNTLIRRIESSHFDVGSVHWNQRLPAQGCSEYASGRPINFDIERKHLPNVIPEGWQVTPVSATHANVQITGVQNFLLPTQREFEVKSAGQLPHGFDPGVLYPSRNHPRGLQMTVYAASDALGSLGLDWETVVRAAGVDRISVYAGSAMGQLDSAGAGGMLMSRYKGQRVTSKYCPLSLADMPADFINAYVLGNLGSTGASLGACASFLYNLRQGIDDIRSGRARVALVGAAEAPITPEVMEGYAAMGALATEQDLRKLDGLDDASAPDFRRACRPFAENCGFTIAESAQMLVLFDDELALELGATIYGAAIDVFVNADGPKKSISGPGVGNYVTMARAVAAARGIVGDAGLNQGFVQAHGTGTPQNRVSEAQILSRTAQAFGIQDWPVAAVKCYLGHSIGAAAGDQVASTLGVWERGVLPGIGTIDAIADDVTQTNLAFSAEHRSIDPAESRYAIINAKGFGGNNASATLTSPAATRQMLEARYSGKRLQRYDRANEQVSARQQRYDEEMINGDLKPLYRYGDGVLQDADITLSAEMLRVGEHQIDLQSQSHYPELHIG